MIKKIYQIISFVLILLAATPKIAKADKTIDVTKYGVVADTNVVNTSAIQKLIDKYSKEGGAILYFPAGQYVSGTILLKDNITLQLSEKAELLGSKNIADYQIVDAFKTGNGALMGYCFVGAVDATNVGITGEGTINGRGKDVLISGGRGKRPFLIRFVRSKKVVLNGIKLLNSTAWTAHFFACQGVDIAGVTLKSKGLGNNDGFDIDCSQDVNISNCDIDTGDDAICFKTTWSKMACKNITIKDIRITSNHAGIKFGTESMAPFENIKISDIYIYDTRNGGIKILSVDGAQIRNIDISNIVMNNVRTPILVRLGSRLNVFRKDTDTQQATGVIENVTIRNVKAKAAFPAQLNPPTGVLITGVPNHTITNLTLDNVEITLAGRGTVANSRHQVPEAENKYPEVSTFGPTIPAYGIWARHVAGLTLNRIKFTLDSSDMRPAIIVEDGKDIKITNADLPTFRDMEAVIRLEEVESASISNIRSEGQAKALVRVEGNTDAKISVANNKIKGIKKELETIK
ncbi:MAG TPA: glycosyl hydrolase family 28 protein [Pelobium sp.]